MTNETRYYVLCTMNPFPVGHPLYNWSAESGHFVRDDEGGNLIPESQLQNEINKARRLGFNVFTKFVTLTRLDSYFYDLEIQKNRKKLDSCVKHQFGTINLDSQNNRNKRATCVNCDGFMDLVDILLYRLEYVAAGGVSEDVCVFVKND